MILLVLVALFALFFGKIRITTKLSLIGRPARFYGLTLLLLAYPLGHLDFYVLIPSLENLLQLELPIWTHTFTNLALAGLLMIPFQKIKALSQPDSSSQTLPKSGTDAMEEASRSAKTRAIVLVSSLLIAVATNYGVIFHRPESELVLTALVLTAGFANITFIFTLYLTLKALILKKYS